LKGYGLHVTVIDNDVVEEHNVGRQMFSYSDIGKYKSDVIVERVNRFYGLEWKSIPKKVVKHKGKLSIRLNSNFVITCVDSLRSRKQILFGGGDNYTSGDSSRYYWMDFGNGRDYGQYFIHNKFPIEQPEVSDAIDQLPNIFGDFKGMKENKSEPSCSLAESLNEQDLFINIQLATAGMDLLWKFLKNHYITYHGQYINTGTGKTVPMNL